MPRAQDGEQGFVLIGVVWLLLLCTALVAVMMLRGRAQAQAATGERERLQTKLDYDAMIETVAADLLIEGPNSRWWQVPASGTVQIGDHMLKATVTSEAGRLDLNDADPVTIDDALRGLGYSAQARSAFIERLRFRRSQGRIFASADADALVSTLEGSTGGACPADLFTLDSALAVPAVERMSLQLAHALGQPGGDQALPIKPGEAVRIAVAGADGNGMYAVVRPIMAASGEISISRQGSRVRC